MWEGRERRICEHTVFSVKITVLVITVLESRLCLPVILFTFQIPNCIFFMCWTHSSRNTSALILNPVQYSTLRRITTLKQGDTLIDFSQVWFWTLFLCLKTNPDWTWKKGVLGSDMFPCMYISMWENMQFFSVKKIQTRIYRFWVLCSIEDDLTWLETELGHSDKSDNLVTE